MTYDFTAVHRNLRNGTILATSIMLVVLAGLVGLLAPRFVPTASEHPVRAGLLLALIAWVSWSTAQRARHTLSIRLSLSGLTFLDGGQERQIAWNDVSRLSFTDRAVRLDLHQGPPVVLDLFFANNPHTVREAIVRHLPVAALKGPDA